MQPTSHVSGTMKAAREWIEPRLMVVADVHENRRSPIRHGARQCKPRGQGFTVDDFVGKGAPSDIHRPDRTPVRNLHELGPRGS